MRGCSQQIFSQPKFSRPPAVFSRRPDWEGYSDEGEAVHHHEGVLLTQSALFPFCLTIVRFLCPPACLSPCFLPSPLQHLPCNKRFSEALHASKSSEGCFTASAPDRWYCSVDCPTGCSAAARFLFQLCINSQRPPLWFRSKVGRCWTGRFVI